MHLRHLTLVVPLLLVLTPAHAQSRPKAADTRALTAEIPALMQKAGVPGLAIALISDGKISWQHNFGIADVATGRPVDDTTLFEAASLSKPVFAYAVLVLVDRGQLDLDAPLTRYLPKRYLDGDARLDKITARFVLSHRTGFPNWRGHGPLTIQFEPGSRFSYSGEGIVYLQRVVEKITGKSLDDAMKELVFAPLNMPNSSYVWRPDYENRHAHAQEAFGPSLPLQKSNEAIAAASLHTTVGDYARFLTAVLNGKGLKPATLREMEKPQIAVDPTCTNCLEHAPKELSKTVFWGLGWGIERTAAGDSLWHWGDNGAFKSFVVAILRRKAGAVMFTNSENGLAIADDVMRAALGEEQPGLTWLDYDRYDSVAMRFTRAVSENGAAAALQAFMSALNSGAISEQTLNLVGYRLLQRKQTADSILVFKRNTELHPQSSNVHDSLGEAYVNNGNKVLAIESYERSLALDPKNKNAVEQLARLRK